MNSTTAKLEKPQSPDIEPWQLRMFRRSLKKQQKSRALLEVLGTVDGQKCLLITCGDNNGALNWHFKNRGGSWTWADAEEDSVGHIKEVTRDPVTKLDKEAPCLPFPDDYFDVVMTIDVHEHLTSPHEINVELARVVKTGGRIIVTTPSGDQTKMANRIKKWVGMRKEDYGHIVDGYDLPDLEKQLKNVSLLPVGCSSYSGFFTETIELMINLAYVKFMAKRSKVLVRTGQIIPQSKEQMKAVEKSYKIYSVLYPFIRALSKLDNLASFGRGYAVIVVATKA